MNRRDAIYHFVVLSAGVALLPSCSQQETSSIPLRNFSLSLDEEQLVRQLTGLIIPKNDSIGAADVQAAEFTLMMVDDCYEPEKQEKFKKALQQFDKFAKDKYGNSFIKCTQDQQQALLALVEGKKDVPEEVVQFYQTTKVHTIQAFTTSKEYLTNVIHYKLAPGSNFKGCVPLKKA